MANLMCVVGMICLGLELVLYLINPTAKLGSLAFFGPLSFGITGVIILGFYAGRTRDLNIKIEFEKVGGWHLVVVIFMAIALIGAGVISGFLFKTIVQRPIASLEPYSLYKDLLLTTLAISSLIVALIGGLIYFIVEARLREKADKILSKKSDYILARVFTIISHLHWSHYKMTSEKVHLETAISFAKKAHGRYVGFEDEKDLETVELFCNIKNNLGFFLAERGRFRDKDLVLDCAEYLKKNLGRVQDYSAHLQDTLRFIREKFPST